MHQSRFGLTAQAALLASIAAAFPTPAQSAPAARVDFAIGNVAAVNRAGQSRPVAKGAQIDEGETINTNSERAQLRFTDGAYVSLQPQSEFRIDQYRYEGKQDGSERTLVSLLKGGLRTITGFVGRTNKKNYQVSTAVATIGIRGTEYTIQYGGSISGTVGEGEIEVCNGAGCIDVTNGESYYVANQDAKPQLSSKGTDLPPAPPQNPPADFEEGERVDDQGDPCVLFPSKCVVAQGTTTLTAKISLAHNLGIHEGSSGAYSGTVTIDSSGRFTSMTDSGGGTVTPGTAQFQEFGTDGIMSWGRVTNGTLGGTGDPRLGDHAGSSFADPNSFHYVTGVPTASMPTTGTLSYFANSSTATSPTGSAGTGTFVSASFFVDFSGIGTSTFSMNLLGPGGASEDIGLSGSLFSTAPGPAFSIPVSGFGGGCAQSCSGTVDGFFSGTSAERVGITYEVTGSTLGNVGVGAAVLSPSSAAAN